MFKLLKIFTPRLIVLALLTLIFVAAAALLDLELPRRMAATIGATEYESVAQIIERGGWMFGLAFGAIVANVFVAFFASRMAVGFSRNLRKRVFEKVEGFSLKEFDEVGTASLITRTTNDVQQVQQFFVLMFTTMASAPITFVFGIIYASEFGGDYMLVIGGALGIMLLIVAAVMFVVFPMYNRIQKRLDKLTLVAREGLTGVRVTRAFNRQAREQQRFHESNVNLTRTTLRVNRIASITNPVAMLVMFGMQLGIIFLTAHTTQGQVDAGETISRAELARVFAVFQYSMQIMFAFMMFTMLFIQWPRSQASANRINEILKIQPEINDNGGKPLGRGELCGGTLVFENVTFTYPRASKPALRDISFSAHAGQTTAIIGPTGSGKTTLANILMRFYNIDSGSISVSGTNIREFNVKDYRSQIGYTSQKAMLFKGDIVSNILVGKADASESEILHALDVASAEFALEKGLDAPVAQGGKNFSGGQKQRLSIARAVVGSPSIYLFDDTFSALDYTTDAQVRANLKTETTKREAGKEAITIIVAQRVSTIKEADNIIVLEEGQIVSQGTNEQLLQSCSVYREIVNSQEN
ncbi:MAG: ABC transporter ATP-binding protein/permease [Firmicutes bacterium]|nr:ABC transporter ATP-binding protein/permease [Bacillota bacterium]